jgi:hypothetical protein
MSISMKNLARLVALAVLLLGSPSIVFSQCPDCCNGVMDCNETGIDCGGPDCMPCATLVPNGSFECTAHCFVSGLGQIQSAAPWTYVDATEPPDLFNSCFSFDVNIQVPANFRGNQAAHTGSGYAGVRTQNDASSDPRAGYIQVQLSTPLTAGEDYDLSFWVSLADNYGMSMGGLGAYFSVGPVAPGDYSPLNTHGIIPQIESDLFTHFSDPNTWSEITGTYTAVGGENYIVIGNFKTTFSPPSPLVTYTCCGSSLSYYYIDDVSLIPTPCIPPTVPTLSYTPATICNGDMATINITGSLNDAPEWFIYSGSCGGTLEGSTSSSTFNVTPSGPSTTYYVRGEDGTGTCVDESSATCSIGLTIPVADHNTGTDAQTACDSYTWIDSNTYTSSNNSATWTLTNAAGCDSVVTLDLIVNNSTTGTDAQTACDTYTWMDGNTYTSNNNSATWALTTTAGCDSVVTLDLVVNNSTAGTDVQTACDTYTWIDGNTYTNSNNSATWNLTNAVGCDSVVTLDLTITNSTVGTDIQTACDTYTWIDGNTYTSSNNSATWTLTNAAGCDSVVTLDLTINNSTTGTDVQTACDTYTWIDGNTYTSSNNSATWNLTSAAGCDSLVTLDLTINTVNSAVTQSGALLTANETGATYQWLDCPGMTVINGETNQSYTATANGDYAVIVTINGCSDTSTCYTVTGVGMIENDFGKGLLLYPNPTDGNFSIDLGDHYASIKITITDITGKIIQSDNYTESQLIILTLEEPAGAYLLIVESGEKKAVIRLVKE